MKKSSYWLYFTAMVLAALNMRPGITSFAPLIERIAEDLSMSRGLAGLTTAMPVLMMGLMAPLAPRLAVRWGLERTLCLCMLVIGCATVLRIFGQYISVLILTSIFVGGAIAVTGPLLSGFVKRYFAKNMGLMAGIFSLSMAVGGTLGVVLTVPATSALSNDWRWGLASWALLGFVAFFVWLCVPNVREEGSQAAQGGGLPWRSGRAWLLSSYFALQAGLFYAIATWMVARFEEAGHSAAYSNVLFSSFMLVGLPSSLLMPWIAQRVTNRHWIMMFCGVIAIGCLAAITWAPMTYPLLMCSVLGAALNATFSLALTLPMYEAKDPIDVSRLTSMMLFSGYSIGSVSPVLVGIARDMSGTYQLPFIAMTAVLVVMVILASQMGHRRQTGNTNAA